MAIEKPCFKQIEIDEPPTAEQMNSEKKTKYNRHAYEWYMESTIHQYFNETQARAEHTYKHTKAMIKKTAVLAVTSTAVAIAALVVAAISVREKR